MIGNEYTNGLGNRDEYSTASGQRSSVSKAELPANWQIWPADW